MTVKELLRMNKQHPLGRIYLGSPYSHPHSLVRSNRYNKVAKMTAHLTRAGLIVFSPVVHGHCLSKLTKLPRTHKFWSRIDETFLRHWAEALVVYQIQGWSMSEGLDNERHVAERSNMLTIFLQETTL